MQIFRRGKHICSSNFATLCTSNNFEYCIIIFQIFIQLNLIININYILWLLFWDLKAHSSVGITKLSRFPWEVTTSARIKLPMHTFAYLSQGRNSQRLRANFISNNSRSDGLKMTWGERTSWFNLSRAATKFQRVSPFPFFKSIL